MSPRESDPLCLKRKLNEDEIRNCKAPRISEDCGPSPASAKQFSCHRMRPSIADNCHNYINSGPPRRFMYYKQGGWLDFPQHVVLALVNGFRDDKSFTMVTVDDMPLVIDFLSMTALNLKSRRLCSVAWIDECDKCFFPSLFFDNEDDNFMPSICDVEGSSQRTEIDTVGSPSPEVFNHVAAESQPSGPKDSFGNIAASGFLNSRNSKRLSIAEVVCSKLVPLDRMSENFLFAQNLFLSGMKSFAGPANICSIYRYVANDANAQQRDAAFTNFVCSLKEKRGNANVSRGWLGCSKRDMLRTLVHGYCSAQELTNGRLGSGVYLTPEDRAFASVCFSDNDEKGFQYMVLCRVVLGNMEEVRLGQQEHFPSSKTFDSCVDNCSSPKFYFVPSCHSSFVLPEFVIKFMLSPVVRDYLLGLKGLWFNSSPTTCTHGPSHNTEMNGSVGKPPSSPWISFKDLFAEFEDSMPPLKKELLSYHYQELKNRQILREDMVKKLRIIVGDEVLASALAKLQRRPSEWHGKSSESEQPVDSASVEPHLSYSSTAIKKRIILHLTKRSDEPSADESTVSAGPVAQAEECKRRRLETEAVAAS